MPIVSFVRGGILQLDGDSVTIVEAIDLNHILVRTSTGHHTRVKVADLIGANVQRKVNKAIPLDAVRARKIPAWSAAVGPLIDMPNRTRSDVEAAAAKLGCSADAVYDALRRFNNGGKLEDLPPRTRNGGRGKSRLGSRSDKLIDDCIAVLLTRRHHSTRYFYRSARVAFSKAGITLSKTAMTARLKAIPAAKYLAAREGHTESRRRLGALKGKHPEFQRPFQLVQIDHWTTDIEIYNGARTALVGRPCATFIVCAKTKVFAGFNIGFDPPGGTATGLALISMFTRKDALLEKHGLTDQVDWPFWGTPGEIASDNGADFTGRVVTKGCENYKIDLTHRPVGGPQYGAFIESLNRTVSLWFKDLPGATGSNPVERKKLRPELTAAFNLDDLEKQMILLIHEYHDTVHSSLGITPRQAYEGYYFGPDGPKHPLPAARVDDLQLRVDWYPIEHRTIQRYGVTIDHLQYFGEEMAVLVPNRKKGTKVEVRRNPYDVTEVYIRHPETGRWMVVPCTTIGYPRISIFEHEALVAARKGAGRELTPMALVEHFDAQQRNIDNAIKLTKTAKRAQARAAQHAELKKTRPVTSKSPAVIAAADGLAAATPATSSDRPQNAATDSLWVVPSELTEQYLLDQLDD